MRAAVYIGSMARQTVTVYAPNRVRELRKQRRMTMEELAARTGQLMKGEDLSIATIRKLEVRKMGLTVDYILPLSRVLGVSPCELIEDTAPGGRSVPLAGRIAAGNWREAIEDVARYIPIPPEIAGPNAFALQPMGDSMDKIVDEDGFIVVDPDELDLRDGKVYAIANSVGDTTFKIYRSSPARLEPCSNNPEHQPIPIGREAFTTIGRVVFAGRML